jgi:hypothetical protein
MIMTQRRPRPRKHEKRIPAQFIITALVGILVACVAVTIFARSAREDVKTTLVTPEHSARIREDVARKPVESFPGSRLKEGPVPIQTAAETELQQPEPEENIDEVTHHFMQMRALTQDAQRNDSRPAAERNTLTPSLPEIEAMDKNRITIY